MSQIFVTVQALFSRMIMRTEQFLELSRSSGAFNEKSLSFQQKILERSGLGEETYLPDGVHT